MFPLPDTAFLTAVWGTARPLWFIRHDDEPRDTNRPEVVRRDDYYAWEFTEPWQWYGFDLLMWSKYGMVDRNQLTADQFRYLAQAFASVYADNRFITNGQFLGRANYISGENLGEDNPAVYTLVCGGGVLAGEQDGDFVRCETSNARKAPPSIADCNPATHPWLFVIATIIRTDLRVTPFPQLDGADVWVPLASYHDREPARMPFWDDRWEQLRLEPVDRVPSPYR